MTVSQAADTNYGGSTGGGYVTLSKAAGGTGDTATGTGTYGRGDDGCYCKHSVHGGFGTDRCDHGYGYA